MVTDIESQLGCCLGDRGDHGSLGDKVPCGRGKEGEERVEPPLLGREEVGEGPELVEDGARRAEGGREESAGGGSSADTHVFAHYPLRGGVGLGGGE